MYVYGKNFKKDTLLLYPKHLSDVYEELKLGEGDDLVRLKMKSLDLGFDGEYSDYIDEIKNRLERI
jgi:hypothetical protein